MGLIDRVKAQATQIAQMTQEAAQAGQGRLLDQVQTQRGGDVLLRHLGALVFAERTGRGNADSQARIDQMITALSEFERQNALNLAVPAQQWPSGQTAAGQPGPFQGPPAAAYPSPAGGPVPDAANSMFGGQQFFPAPDQQPEGGIGVDPSQG